jgi:hypothetical protein
LALVAILGSFYSLVRYSGQKSSSSWLLLRGGGNHQLGGGGPGGRGTTIGGGSGSGIHDLLLSTMPCADNDPIQWPPKFITDVNETLARHYVSLGLQDLDRAARKRGTACTSPTHGTPYPFMCDPTEDLMVATNNNNNDVGGDTGGAAGGSFLGNGKIYGGVSRISGSRCSLCAGSLGGQYFADLARMLSFYAANSGNTNNNNNNNNGCSSLVVFGVAFGSEYFQHLFPPTDHDDNNLHRQRRGGGRNNNNKAGPTAAAEEEDDFWHHNKNVCFFTFVLEEDLVELHGVPAHQAKLDKHYLRHPILSHDRIDILIPVPRASLPYTSMRRNTKLFKMHSPALLFSFAERVVWQDAKFRRSDFIQNRPKDYLDYFRRTVDRTGTCVSLMTLPKHANTMGAQENCLNRNLFHRHCQTLLDVDAKGKRTGKVTDSRDALAGQCAYYLGRETAALARRNGQVVPPDLDAFFASFPEQQEQDIVVDTTTGQDDFLTLSDGLIDSAFIVWDRRSDRCRTFGADLACTWSDESRCFSDRDQLSFPAALAEMGLRKDCPVRHVDSQLSDRIFVHDVFAKGVLEQPFPSTDMQDGTPLVHLVRAECHWYFKSLDDCHTAASDESMRVAIVVAGTFRRLVLTSSVQKLLRPLVQQGYTVDYFVSLTTDTAKAYRSGYMNETTWDPAFGSEFDKDGNAIALPNSERIRQTIRERMEGQCGRLRHITVQNVVDVDANARLKQRRQRMKTLYPDEDPDTRFPVVDLRDPVVIDRTVVGNKNLLRLQLAVRALWEHVLESEEHDGLKYGHVFFLRDDSWWIQDFDFRGLLARYRPPQQQQQQQQLQPLLPRAPPNSNNNNNNNNNVDVYVPSCDARNPAMVDNEISDHGLIATRASAELFGRYFDNLLDADLQACADQMPAQLSKGGLRGCNSEMILKYLIDTAHLQVAFVGKSRLPFQRSVHLKPNQKHEVTSCLHKVCQSKEDPLDFGGLQVCSDVFAAADDVSRR